MKTEVYSWRVSTELKTGLEREARRRGISLSAALDQAAMEWIANAGSGEGEEAEQKRLHAAVAPCLGVLSGGDPSQSSNVRQLVRERVLRRHGR